MSVLIENARIFDGRKDCGNGSVYFSDGIIKEYDGHADEVIDGGGRFLMPGLIDSHAHTYSYIESLTKAPQYGVTAMLEMGNRERSVTDTNKSHHDICRILSCYSIAAAPGSQLPERMKYPPEVVMNSPEDGREYVRRMLSWGADYIKIIMEEPGVHFPEDIGRAVCDEARRNGKKTIAHTTSIESFRQGLKFGLDVMTHMPMNAEMPDNIVSAVKRQGITLIPTIAMMELSAEKIHSRNPSAPVSRDISVSNLRKFLKAGVHVIAGSDATERDSATPSEVPYGISLLRELQNQHEAGMSELECLISASSDPADFFGQNDIGVIEPGRRADLLMIDGDPLKNIADIYNVFSVWVEGRKVK